MTLIPQGIGTQEKLIVAGLDRSKYEAPLSVVALWPFDGRRRMVSHPAEAVTIQQDSKGPASTNWPLATRMTNSSLRGVSTVHSPLSNGQ